MTSVALINVRRPLRRVSKTDFLRPSRRAPSDPSPDNFGAGSEQQAAVLAGTWDPVAVLPKFAATDFGTKFFRFPEEDKRKSTI